jgi:uncharacterized protein YjaG (DUF416 family)
MTTLLRFDEARLVKMLDRLPRDLRVVFAAACAERLLPAYAAFSERAGRGDPTALRQSLTLLWDDLDGKRLPDGEVQTNIDTCMELIPQEDDGPWVPEQASAEDAGAAVAYALRCRQNGQSQEAAWAARRAYEALDHFVINREKIDVNKPGAEARVLGHAAVQTELARQRRDLDELLGGDAKAVQQAAARLRDRAQKESALFFGAVS